jgi:hypothetical protein
MQARSQRELDGFQVQVSSLVSLDKDAGQQHVYFSRNFLMDRSSRFFSCGVQPLRSSSTGRSAQIF